MAGTQGIRAGSRVAASGDPVGIGVISASELKGRGRGPGSWSGEFELGSARNGAVSGMLLVTEECVVGVRKVSALVGGRVTSHAPMKVSNCGCAFLRSRSRVRVWFLGRFETHLFVGSV